MTGVTTGAESGRVARGSFHWVPIEQVTVLPDDPHLRHFKGMWWATDGKGRVLLWRGRDGFDSAQGNRQQSVAEYLLRQTPWRDAGAVDLVKIEHAFLPDDPGRY